MPTLEYPLDNDLPEGSKKILDEIKNQEGYVSKVYRLLGRNTSLLAAMWNLRQAVFNEGSFSRKVKEAIALAVATALNCDYCIWAHTDELKKMGTSDEELMEILSIVTSVSAFSTIFQGAQLRYT